jgi:hypothetical protein
MLASTSFGAALTLLVACGAPPQPTTPTIQAAATKAAPTIQAAQTQVVGTVQTAATAVAPTVQSAQTQVVGAVQAAATQVAPSVQSAQTQVVGTAQAAATQVAPTVQAAQTQVVGTAQTAATAIAPTVQAAQTQIAPAAQAVQATAAAVQTQVAPTAAAVQTQVAPTAAAIQTQVAGTIVAPIATQVAASPVQITSVRVSQEDTTVALRNSGAEMVNASGWILLIGAFPLQLPSGQEMRLDPNETVTLHFSRGSDTNSDVYLGQAPAPLVNSMQPGTRLVLVNLRGEIVSVYRLQ